MRSKNCEQCHNVASNLIASYCLNDQGVNAKIRLPKILCYDIFKL